MKKNLLRGVLLLISLFPIISFATDTSYYNPQVSGAFSYVPQVYLEGMAGDEFLGQSDIIVPIDLDNDRALFLYGQGRVSTPEDSKKFKPFDHAPWTGSFGFGSRGIYGNNTTLLGAYVLGDYSRTSGRFNYWDISPGIEALGKVWDFRANGYFPVGRNSWSKEGWADEFGNYDYVKFAGHKEFDRWAKYDHFQEVAPGGDAEIGRKLVKEGNTLIKAYLGGYYFDMKDNSDIVGASARVTFQPSQYITFSVNDTYDRQYHNTLMLGMRVRLNDLLSGHPESKVTEDKDLSVRLLDPVERNLGSIADAASIPVSKGKMTPEGYGLEHDNLWFFNQAGSHMKKGHFQDVEDGTYEHPFDGFDEDKVDYVENHYGSIGAIIDQYPWLYFAPGVYGLGDFANHQFALPYGWGMYGRTGDYTEPAQGDERALFFGRLNLYRGNNVLDSIRLKNNGTQDKGIDIANSSNIYMNNISVGMLDAIRGYRVGIELYTANNVTLNKSQVYGYNETAGSYCEGIRLHHGSELTLGDGNSIRAETRADEAGAWAYGIYAKSSTVNISGSDNSISAKAWGGTSTSGSGSALAWGIYASHSTVNISGSDNSISAKAWGGNSSGSGDAFGVAYGIYANDSTVNISGSDNSISAKAWGGTSSGSGSVFGRATGIDALHSTVNFASTATGTTITVGGFGGSGTSTWGIDADSNSKLQIDGSNVTNLDDLLDYISFTNTSTVGSGKKIKWGTLFIDW